MENKSTLNQINNLAAEMEKETPTQPQAKVETPKEEMMVSQWNPKVSIKKSMYDDFVNKGGFEENNQEKNINEFITNGKYSDDDYKAFSDYLTEDNQHEANNILTKNREIYKNGGGLSTRQSDLFNDYNQMNKIGLGNDWQLDRIKEYLETKDRRQKDAIDKYFNARGIPLKDIDKYKQDKTLYPESVARKLFDQYFDRQDRELIGKNPNRRDKYGNYLYNDEVFNAGYNAGKKYLDELLKYNTLDKLKGSNVFLNYLEDAINKGIHDEENDFKNDLDPNYSGTYQDTNEIIGALLGEEVDMEKPWYEAFTGKKYEGYRPSNLGDKPQSQPQGVKNKEERMIELYRLYDKAYSKEEKNEYLKQLNKLIEEE